MDGTTIKAGKFQYEVASYDDSGGVPAKIKEHILVRFLGMHICCRELSLEDEGVLGVNGWRIGWI